MREARRDLGAMRQVWEAMKRLHFVLLVALLSGCGPSKGERAFRIMNKECGPEYGGQLTVSANFGTWSDSMRITCVFPPGKALMSDPPHGPQKHVGPDDVIYCLDGQLMYHAINAARNVIATVKAELRDVPHPEPASV